MEMLSNALEATQVTEQTEAFWAIDPAELMKRLNTTRMGLTSLEATARIAHFGPNTLRNVSRTGSLALVARQFRSPLILILVFAAILSAVLGDVLDAGIILAIVVISGLLGFWQERGATNAVSKLLSLVAVSSLARRDGVDVAVPVDQIVPGDIVFLRAGASIPGDGLIIESSDLFVDEAALTGESYPVEKAAGIVPVDSPLAGRTNSVFMGTHVISGTATVLIVRTGTSTEFGSLSEHLRGQEPETEFEHGVAHFGFFLVQVTGVLVFGIFAINVYLQRPVLESFLFSLALAVGLTPQLLPAITSVNLAHGAARMARKRVIVKRLAAIEDFGSMNFLCCDKTGTLTEGDIVLRGAFDLDQITSDRVFLYGYLNSRFESGIASPIDAAILKAASPDISGYSKRDEIPYDFIRKRLSVVVNNGARNILITKGALENVLDICSAAELPDGSLVPVDQARSKIMQVFQRLSSEGQRTLGLAYREIEGHPVIHKNDEAGLVFLGLLAFSDPPKPEIADTIKRLTKLGVRLKVITGDNRLIARSISEKVGLGSAAIMTGSEFSIMSESAILSRVAEVDIFAEVEPNQKEHIIHALRKLGNVVGYMGDGINDAPALHAANVGISVNSAVDVAKEAAQIILLEKDLRVLEDGVIQGRITFANTIKYVFMATSANFGNMFSMAGASLFLPYLPLLPGQVLLTNLLTDLPEMTIATDNVDQEFTLRPHRWNIRFIRNFMLIFGPVSSLFDYATFAVLLLILGADMQQFRTGWFIESVVSASMIVLVIRTRNPFFRSRPGRLLGMATVLVAIGTVILPYTPLGGLLGFTPLPLSFLFILAGILAIYVVVAEAAKIVFYRRTEL